MSAYQLDQAEVDASVLIQIYDGMFNLASSNGTVDDLDRAIGALIAPDCSSKPVVGEESEQAAVAITPEQLRVVCDNTLKVV